MRNSKITQHRPHKNSQKLQSLMTIPVEVAIKLREKGVEYLAIMYNEETGVVECHPRSKMYE